MNDTPLPIIATLPDECCMMCKFYYFEGKACRRNPPAVIVTERKKSGDYHFASKFPPMTPNGWCGEFKGSPK